MGAERQILDFILKPNEDAFNKGMKKMEKGVGAFSKAASDAFDISETARGTTGGVDEVLRKLTLEKGQKVGAFTSGLAKMFESFPTATRGAMALSGVLGKGLTFAIDGLTKVVNKAFESWKEFTVQQEEFARATGMSQDQVREFSVEVISASSKYGVALDKVQNMAHFVAKGYKGAQKEVVRFSGAISNFADLTGSGEEETGKLARALSRRLGMGFEGAEKAMFGYRAIAKSARIETSELTQVLSENENFLRVKGKKGVALMSAQGAAIAASMRESGAEVDSVREVMSALGDQNSRLMDHFRTSGFDVTKLSKQMRNLTSTLDPSHPAAYEKAISDLESTFGVSRQAIEAMANSADGIGKKMDIYRETTGRELVDLRNELEQTTGPLKKLERSWNRVMNSMTGVLNSTLLPALQFWVDKLDDVIKGWEYLFGVVDEDKAFSPTSAKEREVQARRGQLTTANQNLAKGIWDMETYKRYVSQNGLQNMPGAMGFDDVPKSEAPSSGPRQSLPGTALPGPALDSGVETTKAVEALRNDIARQTEIQERQLVLEEEKKRDRRINSRGIPSRDPYAGVAGMAEQGAR